MSQVLYLHNILHIFTYFIGTSKIISLKNEFLQNHSRFYLHILYYINTIKVGRLQLLYLSNTVIMSLDKVNINVNEICEILITLFDKFGKEKVWKITLASWRLIFAPMYSFCGVKLPPRLLV